MAVAVVDTSVLIGMADADDSRHDVAVDIVQEMDRGNLPTGRVTNYVVLELLNWIHTRTSHTKAVDTQTRLSQSAGFELVQTPQQDFTRAVELFKTHDGLAFGDATIAAYMERTEIEYLYSFDDDFDALPHISRLASANNPFST